MTDQGLQLASLVTEGGPRRLGARARTVLAPVVDTMSKVPGVVAVGLGGSRSIGTGAAGSDFDVVIFSGPEVELLEGPVRQGIASLGGSLKCLRRTPPEPLLGELEVDGAKVELFFRKTQAIAQEIEAARKGQFRRGFNALHVVGFISTITISYATYALPLWDPEQKLKRLVESAFPYPETLRDQMVKTFGSEAKIALGHAGKVRSVDDIAHLAALYGRVAAAWGLVLFAANRRYPVIDKGARRLLDQLPHSPPNYGYRLKSVFRAASAGDLDGAFGEANRIQADVAAIVAATARGAAADAEAAAE